MNKLPFLLVNLFLVFVIYACKHEPEPTPDTVSTTPSTPTSGAVTPVGIPAGPNVTVTIGPAGGTIESADKGIRVDILAEALPTSQTITVQALDKSYCPAGLGTAFRLLPHGLTFAKPAAITFRYTRQDVNASAPELLRVAYQTAANSWQSPAVKSLDTTARTVTVQTTHFSDWSLFAAVFIDPDQAAIAPGNSVRLSIRQTIPPTAEDMAILFVPLPVPLDEKYIDKWTLMGEGNLIRRSLNQATYNAPDQLPATNPAAISVSLKMPVTIDGQVYKDTRLVANIYVMGEGITVNVAKEGWRTFPGGANLGNAQNVVEGKLGADFLSLSWVGQPLGNYHWTKDGKVSFRMTNGKRLYTHLYGKAPSVSEGTLQVAGLDEQWIYGTFTVQPAGWIDVIQTAQPMGTADLRGVFRVRRVN